MVDIMEYLPLVLNLCDKVLKHYLDGIVPVAQDMWCVSSEGRKGNMKVQGKYFTGAEQPWTTHSFSFCHAYGMALCTLPLLVLQCKSLVLKHNNKTESVQALKYDDITAILCQRHIALDRSCISCYLEH
eukprot:9713313-Ditylum_brightwellii.AAC.1